MVADIRGLPDRKTAFAIAEIRCEWPELGRVADIDDHCLMDFGLNLTSGTLCNAGARLSLTPGLFPRLPCRNGNHYDHGIHLYEMEDIRAMSCGRVKLSP